MIFCDFAAGFYAGTKCLCTGYKSNNIFRFCYNCGENRTVLMKWADNEWGRVNPLEKSLKKPGEQTPGLKDIPMDLMLHREVNR